MFSRIISETPMEFEWDLRFTTGSGATRGFEYNRYAVKGHAAKGILKYRD